MNFHKKRNTTIGPRGKICSSSGTSGDFFLLVFAGKRNFCKETFLFGIDTGSIETILLASWPLKGKVFINLKVKVCKFIGRKIENRRGFLLTKVRSLDIFFSIRLEDAGVVGTLEEENTKADNA